MEIDQFKAFIAGHRERHPFARLPDFDASPGFYQTWLVVLNRSGAGDPGALEVASVRMLTEPAKHHLDHMPTLCKFAEQAMKLRGVETPRDLSTQEGARAASAGCQHCGGTGMATAFAPRHVPNPVTEEKIAPTTSAYCVCALGRWIERNHTSRHPDIRKRIPDYADVLAGRSGWLVEPSDVEVNRW